MLHFAEVQTALNTLEIQLRRETLQHIEIGHTPPYLVSIIGPNRSGTTACSEVFARLGIPSYLQPIKSIRRAISENDDVPEFVLDQSTPIAVHKETLGSSDDAEFFNPVQVLLAAGYPKDRIHLVAMVRDPAMTLSSWNRIYGEKVNTNGLIRAVHMMQDIVSYAHQQGVAVTHYVHEAIRDNDPEAVAQALLVRTGLVTPETDAHALVDWTSGPRFGEEGSTDIFYDQPPEIFVEGVKNSDGYAYNAQQVAHITHEQEAILQEAGVYAIYEDFRIRAVRELDLNIQ